MGLGVHFPDMGDKAATSTSRWPIQQAQDLLPAKAPKPEILSAANCPSERGFGNKLASPAVY